MTTKSNAETIISLISIPVYEQTLGHYSESLVNKLASPYEKNLPLFTLSSGTSDFLQFTAREITTETVLSILPSLGGAEHFIAAGTGDISAKISKKLIG